MIVVSHPTGNQNVREVLQALDEQGWLLSQLVLGRTWIACDEEEIRWVYGFLTDPTEPLPSKSYTLEYWCPGVGFIKLEEYEIDGLKKTLIFEMDLLAYHLEDNDPSGDDSDPDSERRAKIENVR